MTKKVLVVDDDIFIRTLISKMLEKLEYELIEATGGKHALEIVRANPPDAILLDLMMPDMDGYQICERLKESEATRDIPVIFVTAKTEIDDQVEGLRLGAHDYICKPIRAKELRARLNAALRVKELQDQLKDKIRLQEELEQARQQLLEQYMNTMFSQLAEGLLHELNNPLTAVIGFAELIKRRKLISDEGLLSHIEMIRTMGVRASAKLSSLLCIAREDGSKTYVDINKIVNDVIELTNARMLSVQVFGETSLQASIPEIKGNANQLARAMLALINNAVDIAEQQVDVARRKISVTTTLLPSDEIKISVYDYGGNISPEVTARIFEPFFTTKGETHTGLGLYLVKKVANAHEGRVKWQSDSEHTCFELFLPIRS
ncbi:MAG: response regulator [Acidobacteriota bacterium]